jgi:hypothetical protein
MKKDPTTAQQPPDPATFDRTTQTRPDITGNYETVASTLAGVAERSGAWVKDQVHSGLQDFVSRILYGHEAKAPEPEKEKDKERDLDNGQDR